MIRWTKRYTTESSPLGGIYGWIVVATLALKYEEYALLVCAAVVCILYLLLAFATYRHGYWEEKLKEYSR